MLPALLLSLSFNQHQAGSNLLQIFAVLMERDNCFCLRTERVSRGITKAVN